MDDTDKRALLIDKLRALKLLGMADTVSELLDRAANDNLSVLDVVDQLRDEVGGDPANRQKSLF